MQGNRVKIHPLNEWGEQSHFVSTAESPSSIPSDDTKGKFWGKDNETLSVEPKILNSAGNFQTYRPRSATLGPKKNPGEIGRSLPELNRGRRINENMAPYERFLKEAEREMARDTAANKEILNTTGKDSVMESKQAADGEEIEMNSKRGGKMENSLFEPNYQVTELAETNRHSTANLESDETKQNIIEELRKENNKQQVHEQEDERRVGKGSRGSLFPVSGMDSSETREQLLAEHVLPKGNKDDCWVGSENHACSVADEVNSTRRKSGDMSSNEKFHKTPERETTPSVVSLRSEESKNTPVHTEKNVENMMNVKKEEKQIQRHIDRGQKSGEFRNHDGERESDAAKKQEPYFTKTISTNLTESENSDIGVSSRQPKIQDEVSSENHVLQNSDSSLLHKPDRKKSPDKILLDYFEKLTTSDDFDDTLDFDFIQSMIFIGASVNVADEHGQTILHEVARAWSLDAAQFFVNQGTEVNVRDKFGRSPLHVAAAADYVEMMTFLITCGADVGAQTSGEEQTALHYAAKNGAVNCVKVLLTQGADIDSRDFKGRTPLQVAAEHKHSVTARVLLEEGAPAGVTDDSGMSALVPLIRTMPGVAMKALDQFYTEDRLQQKERYYLNFLDKGYGQNTTRGQSRAQSPLETVVEQNRLDLIMHPTIQRLIQVKWSYFGRAGAWFQLLLNVFLAVVVTTLAVLHPNDVSEYYTPLTQKCWRIVLESFAVVLTLNEIRKEILDFFESRKEHHLWKQWRVANIRRDLEFCHPKWPQECKFIELEIRSTRSKKRSYFHDEWNFVDWLAYVMLVVSFVLHYANVSLHLLNTENSRGAANKTRESNVSQQSDLHLAKLGQTSRAFNEIYLRMISFTLIVIWVRLLKYFRPFHISGPFVAILSHMITATLKWSFVFAAFYIPYTASFWILFGGRAESPVEGYDTVGKLLFTILQLTLVDDFKFEALAKAAPITARILCGSFLFIAVIVLLNLFIALMSDTFQRVHDNARATAAIQRAHFIQSLESLASNKTKQRYRNFIRTKCSPDVLESNGTGVEDENDRIQDRLANLEEQMAELKDLLIERTFGPDVSAVEMMNSRLKDIESLLKSFQERSSAFTKPPVSTRYRKETDGSKLRQREGKEKGQRRDVPLLKDSKETGKKLQDAKRLGQRRKIKKSE